MSVRVCAMKMHFKGTAQLAVRILLRSIVTQSIFQSQFCPRLTGWPRRLKERKKENNGNENRSIYLCAVYTMFSVEQHAMYGRGPS